MGIGYVGYQKAYTVNCCDCLFIGCRNWVQQNFCCYENIVCVFDIHHSHTLSIQHRYVVYKYGLYLFTKQTYPSPVVNANLCFCCSYSKGLHICKHKDIENNSNSFSENRIGHFISEIRKQNNLFHRKQTNKPMTSSLIKQGLKEICTVLFLYLREIRNIQQ